MGIKIRRNNKNQIEVLVPSSENISYIGNFKKEAHGEVIDCHRYYIPAYGIYTIMNKVKIPILTTRMYSDSDPRAPLNVHFTSDEYDAINNAMEENEHDEFDELEDYQLSHVLFDFPVIFYESLNRDPLYYATDSDMRVLPGMNIFGGGNLCLNCNFDPFGFSALDAYIYNLPNLDLSWYDTALSGSYTHVNKTLKISKSPCRMSSFQLTQHHDLNAELNRLSLIS